MTELMERLENKIQEQQDELDYIRQELDDLKDEILPSHKVRWYQDRITELMSKIEVLTELKISFIQSGTV